MFINTAGIGVIPNGLDWGVHRIQPGDQIIVSGTLGDHGATILNLREILVFKQIYAVIVLCLRRLLIVFVRLKG